MSKSTQVEMNNQVQYNCAPLVQDVREPATTSYCDSLNDSAFLGASFDEMKVLFSNCDFESRKNPLTDFNGCMGIPIKSVYWPAIPSQLYDINGFSAEAESDTDTDTDAETEAGIKTIINFNIPHHKIISRYEGSFCIKNAVIRAKFVGDENCHSFYIGEHDRLGADVLIACDDEESLALMVDGRIPQSAFLELDKLWKEGAKSVKIRPDIAELDEFTMLAVTDGYYYKSHTKPRAVNEDLVLFTCYNKTRNLLCDTVASFKNGLCDPETIFSDSSAEGIPVQ